MLRHESEKNIWVKPSYLVSPAIMGIGLWYPNRKKKWIKNHKNQFKKIKYWMIK